MAPLVEAAGLSGRATFWLAGASESLDLPTLVRLGEWGAIRSEQRPYIRVKCC